MKHDYLIWVAGAAYSIHMLEEYMYNWKDWANNILKLPVSWTDFYITNAIVVAMGISFGMIGWNLAEVSLMLPALMVINSIFFHILPTVITKKYSPGTFTAVILFLPVAYWAYYGAYLDGMLETKVILISFVGGAILMAFPVVMLKTKGLKFFDQSK
jgi:hypothetical protein